MQFVDLILIISSEFRRSLSTFTVLSSIVYLSTLMRTFVDPDVVVLFNAKSNYCCKVFLPIENHACFLSSMKKKRPFAYAN